MFRMNPIAAPILLAAAALCTAAHAQTAELRRRWEPGSTVNYTLDETMAQSISGAGVQSELHWKRSIDYTERVLGVTGAGARVERAYTAIRLEVTRDAEPPKRYDSARPDPEVGVDIMIAPFIGLAGSTIAFTISPEGRVSDLTGAAETLDALLGPLAQGSLSGGLSAFSGAPDRQAKLATQIEQALGVIPGKSVARGAKWPVEIDHASPLAGSLSSDLTATFKAIDPRTGDAVVVLDGALSQGPDPEAESSLVGLMGITLDSSKISGTIRFDEEAGRVASSTMALNTAWTVGSGLLGGNESMKQTIKQTSELKARP